MPYCGTRGYKLSTAVAAAVYVLVHLHPIPFCALRRKEAQLPGGNCQLELLVPAIATYSPPHCRDVSEVDKPGVLMFALHEMQDLKAVHEGG